jgi:hypothetical protein
MPFVNPATGDTIPDVGDPGTPYAQEVSDTLNHLCNITHTGPANQDGYQLTQAALNFTDDLPLNSNNLIAVRSVRFVDETSNLVGSSDTNCLYDVNGDLVWNNASGVPVHMTSGGTTIVPAVNELTGQTIIGVPLTILPANPNNLINVSTLSAPVTITLPAANTVPAWRFYYIVDIGNDALTHPITIQVAPGSGNTINAAGVSSTSTLLTSNGASALLYTDGISVWYLLQNQTYQYQNQTIALYGTSALRVHTGGEIVLDSGATLSLSSGSTVSGQTNFALNMTGAITMLSGAELLPQAGAVIAAQFADNIQSTVAGGISSQTLGGIALNGGAFDTISFGTPHILTVGTQIGHISSLQTYPWQEWESNQIGVSGPTAGYSASPGSVAYVPLQQLHQGAFLTTCTVYVYNRTAPRTACANPPSVTLYKEALNISGSSAIGGPVHALSGFYASNTPVALTMVAINEIVDTANYMYYIALHDEFGTNFQYGVDHFVSYVLTYSISNMNFGL